MSIDDQINQNYAQMLLRKAIRVGECMHCHKPAKQGYPKINKLEYAHRFIYATLKGDPGELFVRHTCDNRLCINPDHLILGTHQDNMDDMVERDRANGGGGKPRLFDEAAEDAIAALYATGLSQRAIARQYNTNQVNIWKALKRHEERHEQSVA